MRMPGMAIPNAAAAADAGLPRSDTLDADQLRSAIVNASHDAIWSWNPEGIVTSWNAEAERLFGYAAAEIIGNSLLMLVPPDRMERAHGAIGKLLSGEFFGQYETVRVRKDGTRIEVELTVSPIYDRSGAIAGAASVCRDITERKEVEARLRLALEAAQLGIWDWNLLTNEMIYSPRAKEIYGFDADKPVTFAQVREATHPDDLPVTAELSRRARDPSIREKKPYEFRIIRPNGARRWILAHGEAVFAPADGGDKAIRYVGTVQDITEFKHAQEQQAFLINEMNHRVKNTLATVQSLAVMTSKTKTPSEFADAFGRRLAALSATHDLLTHSGWERAPLDAIVETELKPFMAGQITVARALRTVMLTPKAALTLGLVFHELATNAAKHGALSCTSGRLDLQWEHLKRDGHDYLSIRWREHGGPAPKASRIPGFGSRLIESSIKSELSGTVALDYSPSGFSADIELPLAQI
jgi:PAS domain S-box-containing protein